MPTLAPVPRSAIEWSDVFRAGEVVQGLLCRRPEPGESFYVKCRDYVSIYPDGSGRDDAIKFDRKMYARIAGLCKHPELGSLVKLHWYFSYGELTPDEMANQVGRDFIVSQGENELVSLSHDTYTFAERIHSLERVINMTPTAISFPVIDAATLFARGDKTLIRSFNMNNPTLERYELPLSCVFSMCTETCDGQYTLPALGAEGDILRWCFRCNKWLHTTCCERSNAVEVSLPLPRDTRPLQPQTVEEAVQMRCGNRVQYGPFDWLLWQQLSTLPIQRGMPGLNYPLSFELIVSKIREEDAQNGCPNDVQEYLLENIGVAKDIGLMPQEALAMLQGWKPEDIYECPRCGNDI
ncbi:hypothetical protein C2E23DRAFT_864101 [Lenzites betulinus]|nr:hypothetical protein C2E23DRAFT_864101 [Lenzites betulinus]